MIIRTDDHGATTVVFDTVMTGATCDHSGYRVFAFGANGTGIKITFVDYIEMARLRDALSAGMARMVKK